ncbi:S-adenosyl methyltransferase [Amycolatopsis arida]|uniref:S-adenosyl methyltransferase n=1 Tax=Amycolatopsis arida TaxID=587909 RepID=A0A1I5UNL4_9PSEU|nr:SAM-dependent methyltransferase [Amycolatopsis arida]TDX90970.1 S-adenosyl methyltransferase [Amycolatopsis arida]SFP96845.1 S-adenosyl methyltransferase [Amycolatopsis arida]
MSDEQRPVYVPQGVDLEKPNAARTYDWYLGGTTNWAVDREFGKQVLQAFPSLKPLARINREFLRRAVRYCAAQGIHQFLDIGSGVPTAGNVHEVAEEVDPTSRVVYVDNEPVAVAHSKVLLEQRGDPRRHATINADLRDPEHLWNEATATGVLDPNEPMALLMVAVLHFIPPGAGAEEAVARYKELLPSGSYLVVSHATNDGVPPHLAAELGAAEERYKRANTPVGYRTREQFSAFFDGFELVEPGVVWFPEWHLDDVDSELSAEWAHDPPSSCGFVGVARKP